jgi:quinol monooxygenase YgiN
MSMVIVIARVRPLPERRQELIGVLEEVQAASRRDDGCLHYGYYTEIADAGSMVAVEEWRDRAALEAHLAQPHILRLVRALAGSLAAPPEIVAHEVSASGPLPPIPGAGG